MVLIPAFCVELSAMRAHWITYSRYRVTCEGWCDVCKDIVWATVRIFTEYVGYVNVVFLVLYACFFGRFFNILIAVSTCILVLYFWLRVDITHPPSLWSIFWSPSTKCMDRTWWLFLALCYTLAVLLPSVCSEIYPKCEEVEPALNEINDFDT
eukprot:UN33326